MTKSGASQGQSASELISKRIAELGDGSGRVARPFGFALTDPYGRLSRIRLLVKVDAKQVVTSRTDE